MRLKGDIQVLLLQEAFVSLFPEECRHIKAVFNLILISNPEDNLLCRGSGLVVVAMVICSGQQRASTPSRGLCIQFKSFNLTNNNRIFCWVLVGHIQTWSNMCRENCLLIKITKKDQNIWTWKGSFPQQWRLRSLQPCFSPAFLWRTLYSPVLIPPPLSLSVHPLNDKWDDIWVF